MVVAASPLTGLTGSRKNPWNLVRVVRACVSLEVGGDGHRDLMVGVALVEYRKKGFASPYKQGGDAGGDPAHQLQSLTAR